MKRILVILLFSSLCNFSLAIECDKIPKNDELRLKKDMLCNYDKSVRPNSDSKNATAIKVKMVLKSFNYADYSNDLAVSVWMVMTWVDDHFKWNPSEYGGLATLYELSDNIWTPEFSLYNSATVTQKSTCEKTNCAISATGVVVCVPACEYSGHCAGSFARWPYDRQNCTLNFGAWMNTGEEVNYFGAKSSVETSDIILNNGWKLLSISMKKGYGSFACCPNQTFPELSYNIIIERHTAVYAVYLLVPSMVLLIFNVISFFLSPRGNYRWIIISVSFMGHVFYVQQLFWTVPKNGYITPNIMIFYRDSTAIIAVLILNTVIVRVLMNLQCEVPGWLSSPLEIVKDSFVGKFMVDTSCGKMERIEELAEDDTTILVEPKVDKNKNTAKWLFVATLVDRLVLLCVSLTYFFLVILLIPENYESIADLPALDLSNSMEEE